jgi:hypothetical protein
VDRAPAPAPPPFEIVSAGWERLLHEGLRDDGSSLRIACPFIKRGAVERLLAVARPETIEVITRFDLSCFAAGATDLSALRVLLDEGASVRGVQGLHTKLYLLGSRHGVVTSANLTNAGLRSNHELGFSVRDEAAVHSFGEYFAGLRARAGEDLSYERLAEWEERVDAFLLAGAPPLATDALGDEGVVASVDGEPTEAGAWIANAEQAFVKFFGEGRNRASRTMPTLEELDRSGSHWACTYPRGKRPRAVRDGDTLFLARLVADPNDILVFGRATGMRHRDERDDASEADIAQRPWKARWPHYVRVHHGQFVRGPLANGVSLERLMDALGHEAFAPTLRNARRGSGNMNPRKAYMQQAAVQLTPQGRAWLDRELDAAVAHHGALLPDELARLDWPSPDRRSPDGPAR